MPNANAANRLQQRLEALDAERDAILAQMNVNRPPTPPGKVALWLVVREHLFGIRGRKAELQSIADSLLDAGHDLGRYPARTVSCAVSAMPETFRVEGTGREKIVSLLPTALHYIREGNRGPRVRPSQQTARSGRH